MAQPRLPIPSSINRAKLHAGQNVADLQAKFVGGELSFSEFFSRSRVYLDLAAYYDQVLTITYQGYMAYSIEPVSHTTNKDQVRELYARGALRDIMLASLPDYMKRETLGHSSVGEDFFELVEESASAHGGRLNPSTVLKIPTKTGKSLIVRNICDFDPAATYAQRPVSLSHVLQIISVNSRA